jgi:hypothetical protein
MALAPAACAETISMKIGLLALGFMAALFFAATCIDALWK